MSKDEEFTFNIGKLFKKKKENNNTHKKHSEHAEGHTKSAEKEEEVSFDTNAAKTFLIKAIPIFLLLIPLLINAYYRNVPNDLPITDQFARSGITNQLRNQITQQVNSEYPNLPTQSKNALIEERTNAALANEKQAFDSLVKQNSQYLKSHFKDENGYTYLGDIDSYFYMRYARNIVEHGYQGDTLVDGKSFDTYMNAPLGRPVDLNLYPEIEAIVYRITKLFEPKMTFMQAAFLTPLFLSTIAIFFAFLIGKKLSGNIGAFFAAMIVATNPTVLSRSLGSDNDIFNVMFPLIILFFFFYSISEENKIKKLIYAGFSGLFTGIYSFAWSGWWYIFYFLIGSLVAYIAYYIIYHFKDIKKNPSEIFNSEIKGMLLVLCIFFVMTFISVSLFGKTNDFIDLLNKPLRIVTTLKAASKGESLWPNVYTTVAELNAGSLGEAINSVGSKLFFIIALMGIVSTLLDFKKQKIINIAFLVLSLIWFMFAVNNTSINLIAFLLMLFVPIIAGITMSILFKYKIDVKYSLLLIVWFAATIYASSKGIRFLLLLVPPFAIAFAIAVGVVYEFMTAFFIKQLEMNKILSKAIVGLCLLLLLVTPVKSGYQTAFSYMPHVNDGWYESLTKIRDNSSSDAIINSWWDFGHWFKALADRKVTFDGAAQNTPIAPYIGKTLLTADENEAIAILRMLDCASTNAFNTINSEINDHLKSIKVIEHAITLDKEDSRKYLKSILSNEVAEKALSEMHCDPPEDYFITSEDMVGKSGVWAHFGIWNYERARIYHYYSTENKETFISLMQSEFNYTKDDAKRLYERELSPLKTDTAVNNWIAPWPSYMGSSGCSKENNETITCNFIGLPLTINLKTKESQIRVGEKIAYPASLAYYDEQEKQFMIQNYNENLYWDVFRKEFDAQGNKQIPEISATLINQSGSYSIIESSPQLAGSMFTRLFYDEGKGLSHFEKFSDIRDIQGQRIIIWKVRW
ncbi:MAG: STT3 domain-containing protein [archaeon]